MSRQLIYIFFEAFTILDTCTRSICNSQRIFLANVIIKKKKKPFRYSLVFKCYFWKQLSESLSSQSLFVTCTTHTPHMHRTYTTHTPHSTKNRNRNNAHKTVDYSYIAKCNHLFPLDFALQNLINCTNCTLVSSLLLLLFKSDIKQNERLHVKEKKYHEKRKKNSDYKSYKDVRLH